MGVNAGRAATMLAIVASVLGSVANAGQSPLDIPADTLITLERVGCGSDCLSYSVTVDALGHVEYDGKTFARVEGRQSARIARSAVAELLGIAARIGFFDLENAYKFKRLPGGLTQYTTDLPRSFVSVRAGGRSKRIEDYDGTPEPLKAFEARIDALTRSKRWAFLDESMLASLRANGWTPSGEELAALLERAVRNDDLPIVQGLLDFGADPNQAPEHLGHPMWSVRSAAVMRALLAAGGNPYSSAEDGRSLLLVGSYLEPEVTTLLLRAGLRADAMDPLTGDTPLLAAVRSGNAPVVATLLGAGANPAVRDREGRSALEVARAILSSQPSEPAPALSYRQNHAEVVALIERALVQR